MPSINDYRNKYPSLKALDDNALIDRVAEVQGVSREDVMAHMGYQPKARGMLSALNDTVIEGANAVAGGVKSVGDFVAPGNPVSAFIDENIIKAGEAKQSDVVKAEKARYRAEMEGAEGIGDEVGATLGYVARNPVQSLAQAAGSFVLPGAAVKGGGMLASMAGAGAKGATRAGLAGGAVAGAALSGGDAAGTAYELVKKAGGTDEQATEAARKASVLPAVIGAAGGVVGAERLLAGAKGFGGNAASRALKTAGVEGAQEAIEEGVTQYEGQAAAVPFDPTIDPTKGVAGAATMGAVLGGATGGAVSLLSGKPSEAPKVDPVVSVLAAPSVDDAINAAKEAVGAKPAQRTQAPAELPQMDPDDRREVLGLLQVVNRPGVSPNVARFAQSRMDALLAPYRTIPAGEATEMLPVPDARELTDEERAEYVNAVPFSYRWAVQRGLPQPEVTELLPTGDATEVEPIPAADAFEELPAPEAYELAPVGEASELLPTPDVAEFDQVPAGEASELDAETIQADDLLARDGEPFTSKTGAQAKAYASGGGKVVAIPNHFGGGQPGYVVRPLVQARPTNTRGTDARDLPRSAGVNQRDMAGDAQQVPGASDGRGADAARSGGAVGFVPDAPGRVDRAAEAPAAGNRPTDVVAGAGNADQALSPGSRVTLQGKPYTVTVVTGTAVKLSDGDGGMRMVARNSKTFAAIQQEPNEAARPQPEAQRAEAAAPAAAPATAAPAVVPGAGTAAVEADGVRPTVRTFGSSGYQLTMAQALAKVKELEADARKRKAAATKAPTAFMRDMDEKAASSSATLARKLREDIKQAVNSYPDARAEYAEAQGGVTQPSGEAAPAPAPEAEPAPAPQPEAEAQAPQRSPEADHQAAKQDVADRRRKAAEYVRQAVTKRTDANSAMVWQIIGPDGNPVSGPPGKYPGNDGPLAGSATMGNLGWKTKREAEAALAELNRKADEILGAAPAPAAEPEPAPLPAEQAAAILNAAAEPPKGKERLDVLKDVKAGAITPEEVAAAHPAAEPAEPAKINDAGEKIGGARKDLWRDRGLDVADLDAMSESEGATLATKANVWKPDYTAIAGASDPVTAAMVKVVYDQLAAQPKKDTPEGRRDYVKAMQAVRKVYGAVTTPDQAKNAYQAMREEIGLRVRFSDGSGFREATGQAATDAKRVLFSVYKGRSDPFVFGYNELARARKLVQEGFPGAVEPWTRRYVVRPFGGAGTTAQGLTIYVDRTAEAGTPLTREQIAAGAFEVRSKTGGPVAYAATKADAEAAAKAVYERTKGSADAKEEPDRPHLDKVARENLPQRIDREVTPELLLQEFGFRGVEFGNWAAQDERRKVLALAYDALADLATIVGVPNRALSLNGTMGLAFGARGGGKFAAHYEPGKLVINMTKLRGAGSLAHEWAHALDHYLGELDRADAYKGKARGASGWYSQESYTGQPRQRMVQGADGKWTPTTEYRTANLRPELAAQVDAVMRRLYETPIPQEEALAIARKTVVDYRSMAERDQDQRMKAMYAEGADKAQRIVNDLEAGKPSDRTKRSSFATEAQRLSGKKSDGYWVRPTEMLARAFESYVFDRLMGMGAKSEYLVHGVEQDRYSDGTRYKGNPYPTGAERAAINGEFAKLFDTLKTRTDDAGNVALFSRSPGVAKDVANAWRILAENDEVFTYAKSESTDFAEIANGTGAIFAEPEPGSVGADVERAWRVYPLDDGGQPDKSKPAYVIHYKSGAVQLTIKNFTEGDAGSAAYAAVGNYAFNNGIVFEPDGFGLTQAAIERRLENLISLALKFGSTDFIRLSPNQLKAFKMKWRDGDTAFNTEQMLMASYNALAAKFPEIKDYTYDLNTGARKSDVGAMGRDEPGTEGIVARARAAGARAGERTVARAIFTNTFASEPTGKARRELVGSLGERSGRALGDNALAKSLYSRAEPSRTGVPMADAKAVVATIREALPTAPDIVLHDSVRRAPENLRRLIRQAGADNDVEAVYHDGEIHVFPGNIANIERMQFVVAHHEVRHHGLRSMLGPQMGPAMLRMYASNANLKAAADAKMAAGLADTRILAVEEALADMPVEELQALTGWARIVAAARQWLRQAAAKLRRAGLNTLADAMEPEGWTDNDIAALVQRAEDVSRGGAAPFNSGGTVFSQDDDGRADQTQTPAFRRWFGDSGASRARAVSAGDAARAEGGMDRRTSDAKSIPDLLVSQPFRSKGLGGLEAPTQRRVLDGVRAVGQDLQIAGRVVELLPVSMVDILGGEQRAAESLFGNEAMLKKLLSVDGDGSVSSAVDVADALVNAVAGVAAELSSPGARVSGTRGELNAATRTDVVDASHAEILNQGMTGNSGDFNPGSSDIRFSRAGTAKTTAQDLVNSTGGVFDFNRLGETKQDRLRTIMDAGRPGWLGLLTRDQIADVYGQDIAPVKEYDQLTREMENQRSKIAQDADDLYNEWAKLPAETNDKLARLMLDATVYSVHPDAPFAKLDRPDDAERQKVHVRLKAQYALMGKEGQAIYGKVRDFHKGTLTQLRDALEDRVKRQVENGAAKAAALTKIRQAFDAYLKEGPYFPLSRFGDFIVVGTRAADGERVVASYATAGEQAAAARTLEADGFTVKMKTAKTYSRETDGSAGKFIGDVLTTLSNLDMADATVGGNVADLKTKLMDDVNQLFIKALPDLSYRKHFMHRKGTPGFSSDMMRGFASSAFHAASHIARLNHGDRMTFALQDAFTAIEQAPAGDFNLHSQVLNELTKRHDAALNPNTHPVAAMLNQVGFVMYLGLSPAAGLINMLQTVMVTMPHLGARYGFGKANASLATALTDITTGAKANAKNGWNAAQSTKLTGAERTMMSELQDEGVIDLTQAHDLSAATGLDTGNVARSKAAFAMARAMKIVGWTFHIPEVMNRQVTALSAYRLEMEKTGDAEKAKDAARESIKRTHFDYSSSNRARFMQGNVARVLLQFKQYSQNMTYLLGRAAYQALKGESPEVRSIARRQLVATFAVTWGMAGALGLPGLGAVAGLIGLLVGAMDDEDEPWDWKVEFRNLMADTFGKEAGEVISHGIPRALMPWDISNRVSLGDLWFRDSGREGQSPREAFATDAANILGPTAGTVLGLYTAADHMARGNWSKAAESVVPKFLRDPLKAIREGGEGVTSYNGEPLMDVTGAEVAGRLLGFAPARASEMYEGKAAVMNAKTAIEEKRQSLISRMAKARIDKDTDTASELQPEIAAFNQRNPEFKITGATLAKAIMTRMRNRRNTEDGILLPRTKDSLRELGRFAVD